jgi:hypothetical protein
MASVPLPAPKKSFLKKPAWLTKNATTAKTERSNLAGTPPPKPEHMGTSISPAGTSQSPTVLVVADNKHDMFSRRNDTHRKIQAHKEETERKRAEKRKQRELAAAKINAEEKEKQRKKEEKEKSRAAQSIEDIEPLEHDISHDRDSKRRRINGHGDTARSATWVGSGSESEHATHPNHTATGASHSPQPASHDDEVIFTGSQSRPTHRNAPVFSDIQLEDDDLSVLGSQGADSEDDELVARARAQRREQERLKLQTMEQRMTKTPFSPGANGQTARSGVTSPVHPDPEIPTHAGRRSSQITDSDLSNPVINIFVSSKIPGTGVVLFLRHYRQSLAQVHVQWRKMNAKHLAGLKPGELYFMWQGRRVYGGLQTLADLGVEYEWQEKEGEGDGEMELVFINRPEEGPGIYEEERKGGVHFVATTEEIEERENAERLNANQARVQTLEPEAQTQQNGAETKIKACFRSKGNDDYKLLLKTVRRPCAINTEY